MRGFVALAVIGVLFVIADLLQRTVLVADLRLRPASREKSLSRWARFMAGLTLNVIQKIGGAQIARLPSIPAKPGVLILMNHQSLLDIPLVIRCLEEGYPKIVTRRRYGSGIPLVSHMLRLYEHPLVDPQSPSRTQLALLNRTARDAAVPLVVFPEGTRTRDGRIGPFMKAGLSGILAVRPWDVYLVVADGFWQGGRITDMGGNLSRVRGRVEALGPFPFEGRQGAREFLDRMHEQMCLKLNEMRAQAW